MFGCKLVIFIILYNTVGRIAQSATLWKVRGSNPGGARFSAPVQTGPGTHQASCTMSTVSFRGVKNGRGVTLNPHPLLVPWSWKGRAIPLLPLWAVRPVQSLSVCTRVTFTFNFLYNTSGKSKLKTSRCAYEFRTNLDSSVNHNHVILRHVSVNKVHHQAIIARSLK